MCSQPKIKYWSQRHLTIDKIYHNPEENPPGGTRTRLGGSHLGSVGVTALGFTDSGSVFTDSGGVWGDGAGAGACAGSGAAWGSLA